MTLPLPPPPPPITRKGFSKNTKIAIAIILVASVALASTLLVLLSKTGNNAENNLPQNNNNPYGGTTSRKAILKVYGSLANGYWARNTTTDLPNYVNTVSYSVSNSGNLDASQVTISISIGGNPYSNEVIPLIATSDGYSSSFSDSTPYDQTYNVIIAASCQGSSNSYALSIGSKFPRHWDMESISPTVELFVTPKEQNLAAMKDSILKNKFFLDADWTALWSWVGSNVKYENEDYSSYHWQFSKETLDSKYGMCVDYSTLLVSLYRDGVFGPNDAYVVLGTIPLENGKIGYHAWVIVRLPIIGWYTLEPQANGGFLLNLAVNPFAVSGYKAQYEFNDQQFLTISS